jgi:hypothetical protein
MENAFSAKATDKKTTDKTLFFMANKIFTAC